MKDYATALDPRLHQSSPRPGPQLVPPLSVNVTCGGSSDSSAPSLKNEADAYLGKAAGPLFLIPIWAWIGIAAAGAYLWYLWDRKKLKWPLL